MIFFPIIKLAMCIKKFRILIFVLSPVYMIGKTATDSFCIKIFFLQIGPLLILKSIYKIHNDWYMYYQFISFLFWQQYRRAKFPSIVVPVGTKHLISESLVILSCQYNITFLFLWCSRGCFLNQQWSAVFFYCIPRFWQHFMAVRSGCYQEILRVQPSLYWGTSARFTPITYTCKNIILTVNFIEYVDNHKITFICGGSFFMGSQNFPGS